MGQFSIILIKCCKFKYRTTLCIFFYLLYRFDHAMTQDPKLHVINLLVQMFLLRLDHGAVFYNSN